MHSIQKFLQVQVFFTSSHGKGYNKAPLNIFHDNKEEGGIPEHGSEWVGFLSKINGGPNMIYSIPRFDDTASIVEFVTKLDIRQKQQEKQSRKNPKKQDKEISHNNTNLQSTSSFEFYKQ